MVRHVVLHVCGGIAAYKACELLRYLQKADCELRVCMTDDAQHFVGKTSFEALSKHPVICSLYDSGESPIAHISLSDWADVQVVVPATANMLAKMATGIADDAVSTTLLAATGPVVVAPAMNVHMWEHPATQANIATLHERGVIVVEPSAGKLACGDVGTGRLADIASIGAAVLTAKTPRDLAGRHIVITAGPTHEAIDPVRYIANASSGKMGYAIAAAALARGAQVTLISGPSSLTPPAGADVLNVISAAEMHAAAMASFAKADAAICAAAVADYTPAHPAAQKLKKTMHCLNSLELVETCDILASLAAIATEEQLVVGFAAETENLLEHAREKLISKACDLIVANDVSRTDSTFGSQTNTVVFVSAEGAEALPTLPKSQVAMELLNRVSTMLATREL